MFVTGTPTARSSLNHITFTHNKNGHHVTCAQNGTQGQRPTLPPETSLGLASLSFVLDASGVASLCASKCVAAHCDARRDGTRDAPAVNPKIADGPQNTWLKVASATTAPYALMFTVTYCVTAAS